MKASTIVGILLILAGIFALVYRGISYTKREKILDIGPIEATAERREVIPIPEMVGVLALLGGGALVVAGRRR